MNLKIVLFLLITTSSIVSTTQAQDESSIKKSTIHFVRNHSIRGRGCSIDVELPNQRIFQLSPKSKIDFTVYSTGEVHITFTRTCVSNNPYGSPVSTETMQETINVESGKEYYVFFKGHVLKGKVDKKDIEYDLSIIDNKLEREENLDFPINKESIQNDKGVIGQGSGFLINKEGYILTNYHVIEGAKKIKVKGIKGDFSTSFEATIVAVDPQNDIALIKVESKIFTFDNPPYNLGESLEATKAEPVYAMGYPMKEQMGEELKVTDGIISSLTGYKNSVSMFQFSANVNPGNSGGPLINKNGEVLGIVTAKSITGTDESISYAVKSDYIKLLLRQAEVDFESVENSLAGKELPEQVSFTTPFIYIIETE